jgi:uncharacterized protein (DUF58 family)
MRAGEVLLMADSLREEEQRLSSVFADSFIQFLVGLALFIALLYRQEGVIYLLLLVMAMMFGAKFWCRLSLSGIECRLKADKQKVFPSEKITMTVEVKNCKFLPVWLRFGVPVEGLHPAVSYGGELSGESGLLWKQKVTWEWELTALRRGCHELGPPYVGAGDLFGFYQRKKLFEPLQVIVFPRLISVKNFPSPLRDFLGTKGARGPVEDPVYPVGTRDYRYGRPSRHIHWKSSARHNRLQEKVFEPTAWRKILLVVDVAHFARLASEENFERTLEAVASVAVWLDQQGGAMGIVCNGTLAGGGPAVVPLSKGARQLSAVLEALGRLQLKPAGTLQDMLQYGVNLPWGTSALYFCPEIDDTTAEMQAFFRERKIPLTFVITGKRPGNADLGGSQAVHLQQLCGEEGSADD